MADAGREAATFGQTERIWLRVLHRREPHRIDRPRCLMCAVAWPCPASRALDALEATERERDALAERARRAEDEAARLRPIVEQLARLGLVSNPTEIHDRFKALCWDADHLLTALDAEKAGGEG